MIKEFLALTSCVASIGAGSFTPSRNYQHSEDVGNTEVIYKYESNEVNSVSDLVVGNIYSIDIGDLSMSNTLVCSAYRVICERFSNMSMSISKDSNLNLLINNNNLVVDIFNSSTYLTTYALNTSVLFVYKGGFNPTFIEYVSYTDYNEIDSVVYTAPTTIVGVINEFTTEYLFKDIPYVNDMRFTIGGQEITLMTWLVMVFGLITAVGLFILLFIVFRWLFRMFAGCFKPYK